MTFRPKTWYIEQFVKLYEPVHEFKIYFSAIKPKGYGWPRINLILDGTAIITNQTIEKSFSTSFNAELVRYENSTLRIEISNTSGSQINDQKIVADRLLTLDEININGLRLKENLLNFGVYHPEFLPHYHGTTFGMDGYWELKWRNPICKFLCRDTSETLTPEFLELVRKHDLSDLFE